VTGNEGKANAKQYPANLQGESDSGTFYRALSTIGKRPTIARIYHRLVDVEQSHADFSKKRLLVLGHGISDLRSRWRARALVWLARRFGPAFVLPIATSLEQSDSGYYDTHPEAVAGGMPATERSHARPIEALTAPVPSLSNAAVTRLEGRRMGMTTALRAAVLSANHGLDRRVWHRAACPQKINTNPLFAAHAAFN
jgi:hypothetical protein